MNKNTNIQTYKKYRSKKNKRGEIYYDEEVTLLFRKELAQIYEEKIIELKNKKTYKDRKKVILKDKEWLNDVDIQLYGEKYNMCIGLFETNPFRFTIVSNRSNGFDNCENTIFLYNISNSFNTSNIKKIGYQVNVPTSGIHFEALLPIKDAEIYKQLNDDEIAKIQEAYENPLANTSIQLKEEAEEEEEEAEEAAEEEEEEEAEAEEEAEEEEAEEEAEEEEEEAEEAENKEVIPRI